MFEDVTTVWMTELTCSLLQSTNVYDAVQIDLLFQWHVYDSLSKFRDFMYFYSLYIAIKSWTLSPIY